MGRPSKVEACLSADELERFNRKLSEGGKPTLERVRELAGEFGLHLSLTAASTAREGFENWLDKQRRSAELTEQILTAVNGDPDKDPLKGATALAAIELFEQFRSGAEIDIVAFSKAIQSLTGARQTQQATRISAEKHERERERWAKERKIYEDTLKRAAEDGGISPEMLEDVERRIGLL